MTDGLGEPIVMAFIAGEAVNKHHGRRSDDEIAIAATAALFEFSQCVYGDRAREAVGKERSGHGVNSRMLQFKVAENIAPFSWIIEN